MQKKNDILEVEIASLGYGGEGVVKHKGSTIFVPRTVPGDRVRVRIRQAKEHYARGELVELLKPSGFRVRSGCNAFENGCGGCQWLNINYAEQLKWKTRLLKETVKFRGKMDFPVEDIVGMKEPFRYRNKLSLLNRKEKLVFMQEDSDRTIVFDRCNQETGTNQKVYEALRKIPLPEEILQVHIRSVTEGNAGICFFVKKMTQNVNRACSRIMKEIRNVAGIGVAGYRDYHTITGKSYLEQKVGGLLFRIPLNGFFQTNYTQARVLQEFVENAAGEPGNLLDLYCGTGFFSLPLARKAKRVTGVENNTEAIRNAGTNAVINGITNCEFIASDVLAFLQAQKPGVYQTIILDPPRSGCEPDVLKELLRIRPKTLAYISCSPESLVRDLKTLTEKQYKAVYCKPVDMFPHTYHIEALVKLELIPR